MHFSVKNVRITFASLTSLMLDGNERDSHSRATCANVRFLRFLYARGKSWASHMQAMVFPWFITTYFLTSKYTIFKIPSPKTKPPPSFLRAAILSSVVRQFNAGLRHPTSECCIFNQSPQIQQTLFINMSLLFYVGKRRSGFTSWMGRWGYKSPDQPWPRSQCSS